MMGGWAGSPSRPFYGRDGLRAVPFFPLTRIENKSNGTEAVPPINRRTSAKMAILGGQLGDLPLPACTLHLCSFPYTHLPRFEQRSLLIRVPLQNQCGIRITGR
jgi:hypothetical protein